MKEISLVYTSESQHRLKSSLLLAFLFCCFSSVGQIPVEERIKLEDYADSLSLFRQQFGQNKVIPKLYEPQILIALSHYPELKGLKIEFIESPQRSIMAADVLVRDVFRNKLSRTYVVYINNKRKDNAMVPEQVSVTGQIGMIGHELGHILKFSQMSYLGARMYFLRLSSNHFRTKTERSVDLLTIEHGLGWALFEISWHILNKDDVPAAYRERKKKYYMSPDEIRAAIN